MKRHFEGQSCDRPVPQLANASEGGGGIDCRRKTKGRARGVMAICLRQSLGGFVVDHRPLAEQGFAGGEILFSGGSSNDGFWSRKTENAGCFNGD
jgi:hypothetical protein